MNLTQAELEDEKKKPAFDEALVRKYESALQEIELRIE